MSAVYLCRGSDCCKKKLKRSVLEQFVDPKLIVRVRCQKVCKAPVVGVDLGEGPMWFRSMDSSSALVALKALVKTGKLDPVLAKRESTKRRGRLRQ